MKKSIISILLIMVITLTMTACINFGAEPSATIPVESIEVDNIYEETLPETESKPEHESEPELKVQYLSHDEIVEMEQEELSAFYSDMLSLSKTEILSADEMNIIGINFYNIWLKNSAYEKEEFDLQSYKVFSNIYEQALENRIPLEEISSWISLPVADILCKYFYSNGFDNPESVSCDLVHLLNIEDFARVCEVFFDNPVMDTNTQIPCNIIQLDYVNYITDMAWNHFDELSRNVSPKTSLSSSELTYQFCEFLLRCSVWKQDNLDNITNIVENILENPYYDVKTKYMYFCNAFYDDEKKAYIDDSISNIAIDSLFKLAENSNEETLEQLEELVEVLRNQEIANKLSSLLMSK